MFHSFLRYNIIGTLIFITSTTIQFPKTIIPTEITQIMEIEQGDTLAWNVEFVNGEKKSLLRNFNFYFSFLINLLNE